MLPFAAASLLVTDVAIVAAGGADPVAALEGAGGSELAPANAGAGGSAAEVAAGGGTGPAVELAGGCGIARGLGAAVELEEAESAGRTGGESDFPHALETRLDSSKATTVHNAGLLQHARIEIPPS